MTLVDFFLNLKLRVKLLFAFGSLLLLTVILMVIFFITLKRIDVYERANEEIDGISIHVLEMEAAVQYFIFEGFKEDDFQAANKSSHIQKYRDHLQLIQGRLLFLDSTGIVDDDSLTKSVIRSFSKLNNQIDTLIAIFHKRGFKDFGLEGQLRQAIHTVEKSAYPYNKADMLTLRRHEKDFFLRKDLKYQNEFNQKAESFIAAIESEGASDDQHAILLQLGNYQDLFNKVVDVEKEIGLKENAGLKGVLTAHMEQTRKGMERLRSEIKILNKGFRKRALATLFILFAVQIIMGLLLAIVYANIITKAIKELKHAINSLSEGVIPERLQVKSNEEIGKTKAAFNQLLDRILAATHFAEQLGKGNRHATYQAQFANDILAHSLVEMQSQLVAAHETQQVINWGNSGVAQLNDIIKNESESLEVLGDRILSFLVSYLDASQGALFILQGEGHSYLNRISSFAYAKKKYINQRIEIGEGLIGQCVLEKETMVIREIPKDYIRITSGLGESLPRLLIILPLKIRENVMGVLELASFQSLEKYQIEFLERIGENIASMLVNRKTATETHHLLHEMKVQAQRLTQQEEELKQNAEEMQATLEQMEMDKRELKEELAQLKSKLKYELTED